ESDLHELAAKLPEAKGPTAILPGLPEYLPKQNAQENTTKYILGPQALAATNTPLPADLAGFAFEPEILTQSYSTPNGPLTLLLLQYPTPQIATEQLRKFEAATTDSLAVRRTGPIIVVESGDVHSEAAKNLLHAVNYQAEITWNEPTSIRKK